MTSQGSAVVVGAGIIGCSVALELARSGWQRDGRRQGVDARLRVDQRLVGDGPLQLRQPP